METVSFVPGSCQIVVPPCAGPDQVFVTAVIAKSADTSAGKYRKGDLVRHCHGLMPKADAERRAAQTNERGGDLAQFWYTTGGSESKPPRPVFRLANQDGVVVRPLYASTKTIRPTTVQVGEGMLPRPGTDDLNTEKKYVYLDVGGDKTNFNMLFFDKAGGETLIHLIRSAMDEVFTESMPDSV